MGVAQIMLDDLDLSNIVIGWYKLFGTSSLVSVPPNGPAKGSSAGPNPPGQNTSGLPPPPNPNSQSQQPATGSGNLTSNASANPASIINKGSLHSLDSYGWFHSNKFPRELRCLAYQNLKVEHFFQPPIMAVNELKKTKMTGLTYYSYISVLIIKDIRSSLQKKNTSSRWTKQLDLNLKNKQNDCSTMSY